MATGGSVGTGSSSVQTAIKGDPARVADFDQLVDEVLAKKGPAEYRDGLSEENWEEELEKIPLFMTKEPSDIDAESAPALAALQDLIYVEDTPRSCAEAHKEDGNEHFKKKRYKEAVESYSEGLRQKCEDSDLTAILFCNRATAQYHRANYRSALSDANEAHKTDPKYIKAIIRGAECCMKLKKYVEAQRWCDDGLRKQEQHSRLLELRAQATKEKKKQNRDKRKEVAAEKLKNKQDSELIETIKSRGIQLKGESEEGIDLTGPHPAGGKVHLSPDGVLVWPVLLLYPEYGQSDYIVAFREHDRFIDHLEVIFSTPLPWDISGSYSAESLELYYEDQTSLSKVKVEPRETLGSVLQHNSYTVTSGTPVFFVLSVLSPFLQHFLRH